MVARSRPSGLHGEAMGGRHNARPFVAADVMGWGLTHRLWGVPAMLQAHVIIQCTILVISPFKAPPRFAQKMAWHSYMGGGMRGY